MPHHIPIILDKSALQSLSKKEARWLFHHFSVNMPPIFFAEIIADLHRDPKRSQTGSLDGDVRTLTDKVDSASVYLNCDSLKLLWGELNGYPVTLDGRPVLEADSVPLPKGGFGAFIDQTPFQKVMDRWLQGDFDEMERLFAKQWRTRLAEFDFEQMFRDLKPFREKTATTAMDVMKRVEYRLFRRDHDYSNLVAWLTILRVPAVLIRQIVAKWKHNGRPDPRHFLPYTAYIVRLRAFFITALAHQVISTRPSNSIDFQYLEYLPFTRVFASADKLHAEMFPLFGAPPRVFISAVELKASMGEFSRHYDSLSDEERKDGSYTYADFPPVNMENSITKIFDHFIPNWRVGANRPSPPRDPAGDEKIRERLEPILEALKAHERKKNRP